MGLLRRIARKVLGGSSAQGGADAPSKARTAPAPAPSTPAAPAVAAANSGVALARIDCGAQELKERLDAGEQIVIVDVRNAEELESGKLPGAIHIPLGELSERWRELERANEIVCYCARGGRSLTAAQMLRDNGLFNATSLEGGVPAWTDAGGALE